MKISRRHVLALGLGVGLGLTAFGLPHSATAGWEPKKPVEFIVMAGKGGGADKAVRLMQSIIAKHKMAPVPFTPINKPGGTGAEALVHLGRCSDAMALAAGLDKTDATKLRKACMR